MPANKGTVVNIPLGRGGDNFRHVVVVEAARDKGGSQLVSHLVRRRGGAGGVCVL